MPGRSAGTRADVQFEAIRSGGSSTTDPGDQESRQGPEHTYRIRNRRTRYGTNGAGNMGRTAKELQCFFGADSYVTGKTPQKVFTSLRTTLRPATTIGRRWCYLLPQLLWEDAEIRYTHILPDAASCPGAAKNTIYPEAVTWFFLSYADPHTLVLAPDDFWQAVKADAETVKDFSYHLSEISELFGNIHQKGTLKKKLMTRLPKYLRRDANV